MRFPIVVLLTGAILCAAVAQDKDQLRDPSKDPLKEPVKEKPKDPPKDAPKDEPKNLAFGTKLKSVAVFRDGFGFYRREGRAKLENGWATTSAAPAAVRGTIWVYATDPTDRIEMLVTTKENKVEFTSAAQLKERLADKMNMKLIVVTKSGQRFEGELVKILDDMLLLRNGAAYNAVPYDQAQSVMLVGYPLRVKVETPNPGKTTTLGISYLQEGIRWEPSYVLKVTKGKAGLTLRASMQNTTEALSDTEVMFVVGSPFVINRGQTDVLNVPGIAMFMPAGAEPLQDFKDANASITQPDKAPPPAPTGPGAGIVGEDAGELYFYTKKALTLATNDVAMISLFNMEVPVTPQFEWNADGEEVIYLLNIRNTTRQPLTTGPVFVLEDDKPLGQETIKYTATGAVAELRISKGIGLKVEKIEAEVKRGPSVRIGKSEFVPVTVKGTLSITNFRTDKAPVKVMKSARGRITGQSDGGRIKHTQVLSGEPNPLNDLEWNVEVGPGETKALTYTVDIYMLADKAAAPPVQEHPDSGPID